MNDSFSNAYELPFLKGGGEMGALMREKDWAYSLLGAPQQWNTQLKQLTATMLCVPSPMLICWGAEFIQLYNDAFRPILGNNKHPQALGISASETYSEIWDTIRPLFEGVLKGEPVRFHDFKLVMDRNGFLEDVYFDFTYSPILNELGKVEGIIVICSETTTKVNYLSKLATSEQRFKNLIREASVGMIVLLGEDMRITIVNEAYAKLIGRTSEELLGRNLYDVIPETKEYFGPINEGVRRTGQPLVMNDVPYAVKAEGKNIEGFLNLTYQPYKDSDDTLLGIMVVCQDVTEQVNARHRLEESESRFRELIKQAPVAILLLRGGPDFFFETVNDSMLSFMGKNESVVGKRVLEVVPELQTQAIWEILNNVHATGEPYYANELPVEFVKDGRLQMGYYTFSYVPLKEKEKVSGILQVVVDMTSQVHARRKVEESEERLEKQNKELVRINNELDNFVYAASHDLKSPVSNIEGLVSTLHELLESENCLTSETSQLIRFIEESVTRFKSTILDLTDISKINNELQDDIEQIYFYDIMEDAKFILKEEIERSHALLKVDFQAESLKFSRKNLKSVLYNLLSNAIKYRHWDRNPEIRIKTEKLEDYTLLTIEDNGLGLSKESISKLFTMFKRFHNHVEGTGIGLYIVKRIIDNAGGKIEITSQVDLGTTFRIYFKE